MQTNFSPRQLSILFGLCAIALATAGVIQAWTGPTQTPPNGNVPTPINVGSTLNRAAIQTKNDQLSVYGLAADALAVYGNAILSGTAPRYINFGSTAGSGGYGIRDNNGVIEYKDSSGSWIAFNTLAEAPPAPTNLYNNVHTDDDCEALGGTVRAIGGGNYLCERTGTSCWGGWTRYSNWGSTQSRTCGSSGQCNSTCTTGSHVWSNVATETCIYTSGFWYSRGGYCESQSSGTCTATLLTVGCY